MSILVRNNFLKVCFCFLFLLPNTLLFLACAPGEVISELEEPSRLAPLRSHYNSAQEEEKKQEQLAQLLARVSEKIRVCVDSLSMMDLSESQANYDFCRAQATSVFQVPHPFEENYQKNDQYEKAIVSEFGRASCGLITPANVYKTNTIGKRQIMRWIKAAAGEDYYPNGGIQPGPLSRALKQVFGFGSVTVWNEMSLADFYELLLADQTLILEIKVGKKTSTSKERIPESNIDTYAHFARVLGFEVNVEKPTESLIWLENTLEGPSTWSVKMDDFWKSWYFPNTSAAHVYDNATEEDKNANHWAVVIAPQAQPNPFVLNATFMADIQVSRNDGVRQIEDGDRLSPEEVVSKSWRLQNSGSMPWEPAFCLLTHRNTFRNGEACPGCVQVMDNGILSSANNVDFGQHADVTVLFEMPHPLGIYTVYFQMNCDGVFFGEQVWTYFVVEAT